MMFALGQSARSAHLNPVSGHCYTPVNMHFLTITLLPFYMNYPIHLVGFIKNTSEGEGLA